jgi:hypothetical protein
MVGWYFSSGLGGIGGWIIFFVIGLAASLWLFINSNSRNIKAQKWLFGCGGSLLVILPSIVLRLSGAATGNGVNDVVMYLGIIGGIVPVILAIGYYISYQGLIGCAKNHLYDATLPECPICSKKKPETKNFAVVYENSMDETELPQRKKPEKDLARAVLVNLDTNDRYDLLVGETRIGRKTNANDVIISDPTVGREHILIREQNGHFTLYDRGSSSGTYVNEQRVRGSMLLESGDEIMLGDVRLKFLMA